MINQVTRKSVYAADFETTSYANYTKDGYVRVFLWSLVSCEDFSVSHGTDIPSFLATLIRKHTRIVYFHNLKFDGYFLLDYFLNHDIGCELIAPANVWYCLKWNNIEFRDSLKKFHCTVKELGALVGDNKLCATDETGKNVWECYIPFDFVPTEKLVDYCVRDSIIVAKAIATEWDAGRRRLTASSEAYRNAQKKTPKFQYLFPSLDNEQDRCVRATYRGGICDLNPIYKGLDMEDIWAYDVNGMYGAVMLQDLLPFGELYEGEPKSSKDLYIIEFDCEFYVKEDKYPFLQIKRSMQYCGRDTEFLRESAGLTHLAMTSVDYELFKHHYDIYNDFDYRYLGMRAERGLLAHIIEKNVEEKTYWSQPEHYSALKRTIAKYNTNMLYGSFGLSTIQDTCVPEIVDGVCHIRHIKTDKEGRYIPFATFVTAQARRRMVDAIQKNLNSWIYSDTDSMYLTKKAVGIDVDATKSGAWSLDRYGSGRFLRQKTYCLGDENRKIYKDDSGPKFECSIKCAGMPDSVKKCIEWDDFVLGARFEGKLQHRVVPGGICLVPTTYTIEE